MRRVCRFCGKELQVSFCDLGMSPLSNSYISADALEQMEIFYPLHAMVCDKCLLVQLPEFENRQKIFGSYAYFSSYSDSWLAHASAYTDMMLARFGLHRAHQVIEIASNDGYLLQYFKQRGIPVLGIEPAANVAEVARQKGIPTRVQFFGIDTAKKLASEGLQADLLLGNNVLAHVPDINDFVAGMQIALKPSGVITMEFPHLLRLISGNQFDTIYHEHFSYFSLLTVERIFREHGLRLFDVDELPTHGGSLRIYACHAGASIHAANMRAESIKTIERRAGLDNVAAYVQFPEQVRKAKRKILTFLIEAKRAGKTIAAYGAPAKGNTLLNYCGVRQDFVDYTVDRSPHKQGRSLPGTRIPIHHPDRLRATRPDYLLILPWNIKDEIIEQVGYVREWGGKFVVPIPELTVIP